MGAGDWILRSESEFHDFLGAVEPPDTSSPLGRAAWLTVFADRMYEPFIARQRAEVRRLGEWEHKRLPRDLDYGSLAALRTEAREALSKFRPATLGQALRLEGVTPADVTLLTVLV